MLLDQNTLIMDRVTIALAGNAEAMDWDALLMYCLTILLCAITILLAGDAEAEDSDKSF